jgi:hypothetical protein
VFGRIHELHTCVQGVCVCVVCAPLAVNPHHGVLFGELTAQVRVTAARRVPWVNASSRQHLHGRKEAFELGGGGRMLSGLWVGVVRVRCRGGDGVQSCHIGKGCP